MTYYVKHKAIPNMYRRQPSICTCTFTAYTEYDNAYFSSCCRLPAGTRCVHGSAVVGREGDAYRKLLIRTLLERMRKQK